MIPKIIHYCWFGRGKMPEIVISCMASWHKFLPEYELILWNEDNFPFDDFPFAQEALASKKYAFVSDVCRLYALYQYGGVYLDTDVEVLGRLDDFLNHAAFSGFEDNKSVPTGIMASTQFGQWAKDMLAYYDNRSFIDKQGNMNTQTNVQIISELMVEKGIVLNNTYQEIPNYITFYPSDFFCPKSHLDGKIRRTANTIVIHHFAGSWLSKSAKRKMKMKQFIRSLVGNSTVDKIKKRIGTKRT